MTKRLGALGAAIAVVTLAVSVVSPALGSSADDDKQQTIRVVAITTEEEFLDLGAEGPGLGHQVVFAQELAKGEQEVGHAGVVCTVTSLEREESQCVATAWFRGGQITVRGLVPLQAGDFTLPITGGSGKYEGAEGEAHVRDISDTTAIVTFHLDD